jgi:hypothetical protein
MRSARNDLPYRSARLSAVAGISHLDIAGAGLLVGAEGSLTAPAFEGAEMVA